MVGVGHHLIVDGVRVGVGAGGHGGAPRLSVERVLHLATLGAAGVDECLGLGGVHEAGLSGRSRRRDVGLVDREGLRGLTGVVLAGGEGGDGYGSRTSIRVVRVGHGVVGVQHEGRRAVLNRHRGFLRLTVVGQGGDFLHGDVRVGQQLLVGCADLHVGTLHGECPCVRTSGGQFDVLQQVDGGIAACAGNGGVPRARGLVHHVARGGGNLYGHHVVLVGRGGGGAVNLERNRSVLTGAHGEVVGARRHGCHDQREQHK